MNDDVRALLATVKQGELGRTLLFDLPAAADLIDDAEIRGADAATQPLPPTHPLPWRPVVEPFDSAVLPAPKSRRRLRMLLALLGSLVRPGGRIVVVAHTRGAGGVRTELASVGDVSSLGSKAHRKVFALTVGDPQPFDLESWVTTGEIDTPDGPMPVAWLPGVFSEGHLDPGTALLLEHLPEHAEHSFDIGMGNGVLAVFMARRGPGSVCGVESDIFALEAAKRTMELNGVGGEPTWSGSVASHPWPAASFDLVMSNPPFHEGLSRTTATTERLLSEAAELLRPDGEIRIVANRFLPYDRVLTEAVGRCEMLVDDGRYRVWRAQRG